LSLSVVGQALGDHLLAQCPWVMIGLPSVHWCSG